jgi:hypothetical protein
MPKYGKEPYKLCKSKPISESLPMNTSQSCSLKMREGGSLEIMTRLLGVKFDHVHSDISNLKSSKSISKTAKMEISHARRILAVSRPDSDLLNLLKGNTTSGQA